ncbi:LegC family aminotransferase [Helicobacter rodentium]|uniref:LegC family aminotransferase n=1 Tax=Helicobacter rodentium TaxID=59617 RepID=UPI00235621DB|nr:LegC family aminotransferase [Helicobacter rodentium]
MDFSLIIDFIRKYYEAKPDDIIPLHRPKFIGNEKKYLNDCIDSTFVSSVGEYVNRFETDIATFCNSKFAVATTNGTAALHAALIALNINQDCEVITQPLSFIATSNAICYTGAKPIYIDVDMDTMGMSPNALEYFLQKNTIFKNNQTFNKHTNKIIKACIPMHTFGHPVRILEIQKICSRWNISLIEDAAESLGSFIHNDSRYIHMGNFGICGILSFNGNKTITCGGGGAILTNDESLAQKLKHITTTAKIPHSFEYKHDILGFNYRLPNINAALAVAQIENLSDFLKDKRKLAEQYSDFFANHYECISFVNARKDTLPNFWLNAILLDSKKTRDDLLEFSNKNNVMMRPIWQLNNECPYLKNTQCDALTNAKFLSDRIINIPSSVK